MYVVVFNTPCSSNPGHTKKPDALLRNEMTKASLLTNHEELNVSFFLFLSFLFFLFSLAAFIQVRTVNLILARGHWFHHPYKIVLFLKILEISQIS